jgi:DNA mismatch repair protein MutS
MQPVDNQTLYELQIQSRNSKEGSLLNFFDHTRTQGGQDALKRMISIPKTAEKDIISVQSLLKSISENIHCWQLDLSKSYTAAAESYYGSNIAYTMSQDVFQHGWDSFFYSWRNPAEFYMIQSGLIAALTVMRALSDLINRLEETEVPKEAEDDLHFAKNFLQSAAVRSFFKAKDDRLSKPAVFLRDYYFRVTHKTSFRRLLDICYTFDAYLSIVKTQQLHRLSFPEFVTGNTVFEAQKIWHPLIRNAVPNDYSQDRRTSLYLLTGANTSGKTTFLKTCGLVVYLAHLGWPVPAEQLRLSFSDRLFTSIHLSDNLELGYSHFYNEIMRIKSIAEAIHAGETCFVIIDELFRGTNQEDAFHCSKTIIDGFAAHRNSVFLISTHLYELLENYSTSVSIAFRCFRTKITDDDFENTFLIENGIASEKVGQLILHKAGIPELLQKQINKKSPHQSEG